MPADQPETAVIRSSLPRYGRVPRLLLRDPDITARAKVLYGLLDDYAGPEGRAFPSRATIATSLGCSTDTVDRAVRELETRGWLHREVRRRDDLTYDSTLYSLLAGPVDAVVEPVDNPVGGGRTGAATGRTGAEGVAAPVRTEGDPREGTTPRKPPAGGRAPEVADDDPAWSAFWSLYPRKTGKGAARRAWTRAVTKEKPEVIIAAARRFAGTISELRYCPHPTTWLNQERWADSTIDATDASGRRRNPGRNDEECPKHIGEFADGCRACASERIAADREESA